MAAGSLCSSSNAKEANGEAGPKPRAAVAKAADEPKFPHADGNVRTEKPPPDQQVGQVLQVIVRRPKRFTHR